MRERIGVIRTGRIIPFIGRKQYNLLAVSIEGHDVQRGGLHDAATGQNRCWRWCRLDIHNLQ